MRHSHNLVLVKWALLSKINVVVILLDVKPSLVVDVWNDVVFFGIHADGDNSNLVFEVFLEFGGEAL